jgi:hypothetical protein
MSTIFKKNFASQADILASGDNSFIERCKQGDNATVVVSDDTAAIYLTYFANDDTVSIVKRGKPSPRLRTYCVRVIKKALYVLPDNIVAWIEKNDSRTKRLLRMLGFTFKNRKMMYDEYVRSW